MLSTVVRTIRAHDLVHPGERVLVAVSGGPDSMALLATLWELSGRLDVELEVATVDHGLRASARAEGELVKSRAEALGLPWHGLSVDVAEARRGRASLQDAARRVRLAALEELALRRGATRIALGHQADDQAETVLFRIVRGTGVHGLAGIPYRRGAFIRPLLDVTRAEIARYLKRRSLPFVEDLSNADPRFARARVRHRLLPLLAEENPRVREALVALAASARESRRAPAEQSASDALSGLGRRTAQVVARLRHAGAGTRHVDISGGRVLEIAYGRVRVGQRPAKAAPSGIRPMVIAGPGTYQLDAESVALKISDDGAPGAVSFDADAVRWPLALRRRQPGDRMRPRGGKGSRKVADLLIDAKVARDRRDSLPVLATAEGIVIFVPGLRPSEQGRPTATTRRVFSVTALPAPARATQIGVLTGQTSV
jgi:tRNA(Ile)-lysidine synthase